MKILILPKFGDLGASSRQRFWQYLPYLDKHDIEYEIYPLFSNSVLARRYRQGKYRFSDVFWSYLKRLKLLFSISRYDIVWIQAEVFPYLPSWLDFLFFRRCKIVVDYDDAIFHNYDLSKNSIISFFLKDKIDRIMERSDLVFAGNQYIKSRAQRSSAKKIHIIPTVVDINRYNLSTSCSSKPVIGWIGSPTTARYLSVVEPALLKLKEDFDFELWVSGGGYMCSSLNVKLFKWSQETEVDFINNMDIGIMPLFDSPWEYGKCGYKLIQYMACSKPVVATPLGVNIDIVNASKSGFLANSQDDWYQYLFDLLSDRNLRLELGRNGRSVVESRYSIESSFPQILGHLNLLRS